MFLLKVVPAVSSTFNFYGELQIQVGTAEYLATVPTCLYHCSILPMHEELVVLMINPGDHWHDAHQNGIQEDARRYT
jgi:hypothetical protein